MSKKRDRQRGAPAPRAVVLDPMARLRRSLEVLEAADVEHLAAIDYAREQGCSWADIGQALGVTRQAVQQRHATLRRARGAPAGSSPP